jgi:hypothetical protein
MSKYFVENETEGIKEIFKKKQIFKVATQSENLSLVDFSYAEKQLYGRVNSYFEPIVPNEKFLQFKELVSGEPTSIKVFNFVADAFAELQTKFKLKAATGEINTQDDFLTDLIPISGYKDPKLLYLKYTDAHKMALANVIRSRGLEFTNVNEFLNAIMPFIENSIKTRPFTYPAYVKSKECPMAISGLVIEIGSKIDANNDNFKYEKFYKSENWEFFLNACSAYGFMVDCNMPNRLVADLNSLNMVNKMAMNNPQITSAPLLINNCYDISGIQYYEDFKSFLYTLYQNNRKRTIVTSTTINSDKSRSIITKVKNYEYSDFISEIGNNQLLEIYLNIRFIEEESKFTKYEKIMIIRDITRLIAVDPAGAYKIFETIINKTFDYSGSLSYIRNREKQLGR